MMPSRAFRSRSSVTWSRSTAPERAAKQSELLQCSLHCNFICSLARLTWGTLPTFIGTVIEDIEGLLSCWTPLLIAEDEVDPLMQMGGHILRLLRVGSGSQTCDCEPYHNSQLWLAGLVRSPPYQSPAMLLDEILWTAGPRGQHHIIHFLIGQLEAAQIKT